MKIIFGKQISKKDAQELAISSQRQKDKDKAKRKKVREEKKEEKMKILQVEQKAEEQKQQERKAKQKKMLEEDAEQQEQKRQKAAKKFTQLVSADLNKNPGIIMKKDRVPEKKEFIPEIIYPLEIDKKHTRDDVSNKIRNTFMNALTALGGTKGLVKWAAEHQSQFYNMLIKIMPKETNIDIKAVMGVVTFSQGLDKVTKQLQTSPAMLAKIKEELIDVGDRDDKE